jgi:hypothetical protein
MRKKLFDFLKKSNYLFCFKTLEKAKNIFFLFFYFFEDKKAENLWKDNNLYVGSHSCRVFSAQALLYKSRKGQEFSEGS